MAVDGTMNYDYQVLEEGIQRMAQVNSAIEQQTSDLERQTKQLMGDWSGQSAQSYDQHSASIKNDLQQSTMNLQTTAKTVGLKTGDMRQADAQQSRRFAQQ